MDGSTPSIRQVRAEFIEKVGMSAQSERLPRNAGRILGLLIFDGIPVAFGDLAYELDVSRGSVSTSVRLLEERGLIKRVAAPGSRQDHFQLMPRPYETMLSRVAGRMAENRTEIETSIAQLPEDAAGPRARLAAYAGFYAAMETGICRAVADLADDSD